MNRSSIERVAVAALGALVAVTALAAGCAPTVQGLLRDHRYDDALCAAQLAAPEQRAAVEKTVGDAIERDLAPAVHLHAVTPEELRQAFDPVPEPLLRDIVLLRLRYSSNRIPLSAASVVVQAENGRDTVQSFDPTDVERVAFWVRETIPQAHRRRYSTAEHLVANAVAIWPVFVNLFTIPLRGRTYSVLPREISVEPTPAEVAAAAPIATRVAELARTFTCPADGSRPCDYLLALVRPSLARFGAPAAVTLRLVHVFGPIALDERRPRDTECRIERSVTIPLGREGALEERINARFGDRLRTFEELRAGR